MLALKAENISKQYRLGQVGTGSLQHDLNRFWHRIRGKEDPYLKIGEANDRSTKGESEYVWSLRDINFEIEQGDAVGIIGRNGAGKSTLLKLLSKVTKPTTGKIYTNGRIASLLEVGTGFNPEMTGRENIFLNGAILGMNRKEVRRKFDEIVAFSGVERYIDTPVKRYSSGMYVRLAFAVAAHLESEILIVDEVLAVGDAEFQKKCLGKMGDVSKGEGRTVLFVSHDMRAVNRLCKNAISLKNGLIYEKGEAGKVIANYLKSNETISENKVISFPIGSTGVLITNISFRQDDRNTNRLVQGVPFSIEVEIHNETQERMQIEFNFELKSDMGEAITCMGNEFQNQPAFISPGNNKMKFIFSELALRHGSYFIDAWANLPAKKIAHYQQEALNIIVQKANDSYFIRPHRIWNHFPSSFQHGFAPYAFKNLQIESESFT